MDLCRLRIEVAQRTGVLVVDIDCMQNTTGKGEEDRGVSLETWFC